MCGLIGAANFGNNKENVNEWIIEQFQDQKSRGLEGFGVTIINDDGSYKIFRATEPTKAMLDLYMNKAKFIVFHHRIPTSSDNKIAQTHPMVVSNDKLKHDYLVIHNGMIRNEREIKTQHEAIGFQYTTEYHPTQHYEKFNDSESIAIELARFIDGKSQSINTTGSAALIALQVNKKTQKVEKLFFTRNEGNPLNLAKKNDLIRLSSEGIGDNIKPGILYSCNTKDWKLSKQPCEISAYQTYTRPASEATKSRVAEYKKDKADSNIIHGSACICMACEQEEEVTGAKSKTADIDTTKDNHEESSVIYNSINDNYDPEDEYTEIMDNFIEDWDQATAEISATLDDPDMLPYVDEDVLMDSLKEVLSTTKDKLMAYHNSVTMSESANKELDQAYENHIQTGLPF